MKQDQLIGGDTLDFVDDVPDYPADEGWTLRYRLVPSFTSPAQAPIELTASAYETTRYRVQETAANTANWKAGWYTWARWAQKSGVRVSLGSGRLEVLPDPAQMAAGVDTRSHVRRVLDALEAVIERKATHDHLNVTIAGKAIGRMTPGEILTWRDKYRAELRREEAGENLRQGRGGGPVIMVRM
jgi:hypothetical protein